MIRKLAVLAATLALAACTSSESETPPPQAVAEAPPAPPPPPPEDSCKSADFRYLIGQNKSQIPVPTDPSKRRVTCTTCPVTMDYRPDRLNIVFDAQTGIVKEVKCG